MCRCGQPVSCSSCSHSFHRRDFLKGCGVAAAAGLLGPRFAAADEPKSERPRVALVFLADASEKESWPYPGYDSAGRHKEISKLLADGCPQVDFVPVLVGKPADVAKVVAMKGSVD